MARVGLIKGNGHCIQTGGNKTSDSVQFGFGLSRLVIGSQYNLGFLYEALLNCNQADGKEGHATKIEVMDTEVVSVL